MLKPVCFKSLKSINHESKNELKDVRVKVSPEP